jgi:hypothetical protein
VPSKCSNKRLYELSHTNVYTDYVTIAVTLFASEHLRSPGLALLQSYTLLAAADVFIVDELLRMQGEHLPCFVCLFSVYFFYGMASSALVLR